MLITLLIGHFFADFVFQSRWMATNKKTNAFALLDHVFVYMLVLSVFMVGSFATEEGELEHRTFFMFVGINFLLHFFVDAITSQVSSYFYETENDYLFFLTLGLDQLTHQMCLIITANYILGL